MFIGRLEVEHQFISKEELVEASKEDKEIQSIMQAIKSNDWKSVDIVYRSMKMKGEFEIEDELLFKDYQVVVPVKLRNNMTHETHADIVSMKRIIRERAKIEKLKIQDAENIKRKAQQSNIAVGDNVIILNTTLQSKSDRTKFLNKVFKVIKIQRNQATLEDLDTHNTYDRALNHMEKYHDHIEPSIPILTPDTANQDTIGNQTITTRETTKRSAARVNEEDEYIPRKSTRNLKKPERLIETCRVENI